MTNPGQIYIIKWNLKYRYILCFFGHVSYLPCPWTCINLFSCYHQIAVSEEKTIQFMTIIYPNCNSLSVLWSYSLPFNSFLFVINIFLPLATTFYLEIETFVYLKIVFLHWSKGRNVQCPFSLNLCIHCNVEEKWIRD